MKVPSRDFARDFSNLAHGRSEVKFSYFLPVLICLIKFAVWLCSEAGIFCSLQGEFQLTIYLAKDTFVASFCALVPLRKIFHPGAVFPPSQKSNGIAR